ncbi:MAG: PfkB family carbohydrate kinase, partial [Myxococcota bacterium]
CGCSGDVSCGSLPSHEAVFGVEASMDPSQQHHTPKQGATAQQIKAFCQRHTVTLQGVQRVLERFARRRVLVVGDPILDRYVHCEALASTEDACPSVVPQHEAWSVGGAGLIAHLMASLGAHVELLTATCSERFMDLCREARVGVHTAQVAGRTTPIKTRYVVGGVKVLKVTEGTPSPLSSTANRQLLSMMAALIPDMDALVVADFGHHLWGAELLDGLRGLLQTHPCACYLDVSGVGSSTLLALHQPRLAAPHMAELRAALEAAHLITSSPDAGPAALAEHYLKATGAEHLIATLGSEGLCLWSPATSLLGEHLPSLADHCIDPVGAGDALLAAMVLADASAAPVAHSAYLGSALAALQIQVLGHRAISADALGAYVAQRPEWAGLQTREGKAQGSA